MSDEPLAPTASGSFDRTPLANLLVYCLDKSLTGTLVLEGADQLRHAVYFENGFPAKVRTGDGFAHLGRVLLEIGLLDEETLSATLLELPKRKIRHGQLLLEAGKIDQAALTRGLSEQLVRKVVHLFELPDDTAYAYYDGKNFLESWGGPELMPTDSLSLLWMGVRSKPSDPRVDAALAQLGDAVLKLHLAGDFKRFGLNNRARGVVDMLKIKPCTLASLVAAGVAGEREVKLVIYTFLISRHLELGTGKLPVGVRHAPAPVTPEAPPAIPAAPVGRVRLRSNPKLTGAAPPVPPAREAAPSNPSSPEMEARRDEMRDRSEAIEKEDYFTMLGCERESSADLLQTAYFQLAKKWHPDRLPEELADMRDVAAKVFGRLTEAFQTLTDADRRTKYIEMLKGGTGSPEEAEKVTRALEAQMEFQKAEILLRKGDVAGATKFALRAADKDPEQADYETLLLWLQATANGVEQAAVVEIIERFAAVLAREPNHQKALWYQGSLLKRLGNEDRAVKNFRKLLDLDPKHIDAQREIRLHEMRRRDGKPEPKAEASGKKGEPKKSEVPFGDLLGKLFKK